ncbi:MAG: hypothetical protein EXS42_02690 [Lacunisphaera sp.]|nr:hypothetical protein [Lacunisphaera sp.]
MFSLAPRLIAVERPQEWRQGKCGPGLHALADKLGAPNRADRRRTFDDGQQRAVELQCRGDLLRKSWSEFSNTAALSVSGETWNARSSAAMTIQFLISKRLRHFPKATVIWV